MDVYPNKHTDMLTMRQYNFEHAENGCEALPRHRYAHLCQYEVTCVLCYALTMPGDSVQHIQLDKYPAIMVNLCKHFLFVPTKAMVISVRLWLSLVDETPCNSLFCANKKLSQICTMNI